ncbi:MAG: hypothetical protein ACLFNT_04015 [Spirochaetales bacterium]
MSDREFPRSPKPISSFSNAKRWFDEHPGEKRRVFVSIGTFVGHGTHVHVTLKEEDEPVFEADAGEWVIPDNDERGAGKERMMKFHDRRRAEQWVEAAFAHEFSPDTHVLVWKDAPAQKWFYRQGD